MAATRPVAAIPALASEPALLAVACVLCGALMQAKVVIVGELFAGEVLLLATAALTFLLRGVGRRFVPWFAWTFAASALLMLLGYVLADLVAATEPAQYLRGWARTALFGLDFLALILLVSHGERLLWWFTLGLAAGVLGDLLIAGTPLTLTSWKRDFGFPLGMLAALLAGYLPHALAGLILGGFGATALLFDYRSLGAIFLVAAGIILANSGAGSSRPRHFLRWMLVGGGVAAALAAVVAIVLQSDTDYQRRREESNIGRYVGLVVAAKAIADSPIVGYGSWAADKTYVQMLRQEFAKARAGKDIGGRVGNSMLPHSQLLQAWLEGGILAALFFVLFGMALIAALRWLALFHRRSPLTPLHVVLVLNGLWGLLFSPFLGQHRIHVACVLATLSLLAWEKVSARSQARAVPT